MAVIFSDTALTIMGVNSQKELVGGVILPGPQLSMASLVQNTAQLPQVDLTAPRPPRRCWAKTPPPACRAACC